MLPRIPAAEASSSTEADRRARLAVFVGMKFYRWTEIATSDKWRKTVTYATGPVFRRVLRRKKQQRNYPMWRDGKRRISRIGAVPAGLTARGLSELPAPSSCQRRSASEYRDPVPQRWHHILRLVCHTAVDYLVFFTVQALPFTANPSKDLLASVDRELSASAELSCCYVSQCPALYRMSVSPRQKKSPWYGGLIVRNRQRFESPASGDQCSFNRGRITRLILPTSIIRPVLK